MLSLRTSVIGPLLAQDALEKAQGALALSLELPIDTESDIPPPVGIPGRPGRPKLVLPTAIKHASLKTLEGRAALLHSIAHIELNAIDLALDIVWRFSGMPAQFYRDWVSIAKEEATHFTLLRTIWSVLDSITVTSTLTTRYGKWRRRRRAIFWRGSHWCREPLKLAALTLRQRSKISW